MKEYKIDKINDIDIIQLNDGQSSCEHCKEYYKLYVGESAIENWKLLSRAKPWYYFFHLKNLPSGYGMLICENDEKIDKRVLIKSGEFVKTNTKYRNQNNVKVEYTLYNNVKRGDNTGEAIYKNNKSVYVLNI